MRQLRGTLPALLAVASALAACEAGDAEPGAEAGATGEAEPVATATPQEVTVRAYDFRFEAPDTVASGPTTFRLINEGPDFHHIWLVRLEGERTVDDLMAHLAAGHETMPDWAVDVGGPNTPGAPGEETAATLELEPGNYLMLCVIPAPDGELHLMKGMMRALTVVDAGTPASPMPEADLTMTLDDYSYTLDRPITAGRHTIRVENVAAQSHEVLIVRLEPGRTAEEFLGWVMTREGPMPGKPLGGVTGIAQGRSNLITVDFEPGDYALFCFVPDVKDGLPHVAHGMIRQLRVD